MNPYQQNRNDNMNCKTCAWFVPNERRVMPLVEKENWNDRLQEHV